MTSGFVLAFGFPLLPEESGHDRGAPGSGAPGNGNGASGNGALPGNDGCLFESQPEGRSRHIPVCHGGAEPDHAPAGPGMPIKAIWRKQHFSRRKISKNFDERNVFFTVANLR